MKVNILISTINGGIYKIGNILLPFRDDLTYIVSHQFTEEKFNVIPKDLERKDVLVTQIEGQGLSISRNNAIKHADGDICVISDDDVSYKNEYIDTIINTYEKNAVDVACFKIKTDSNEPEYKKYSRIKKEFTIKDRPSVSSIEITFRLDKVKENKIRFDTRFGIGSELLIGGEEIVFILDCLRNSLKVCYFPEYIVSHPYESNIKNLNLFSKRRNFLNGAIDYRINGYSSFLRSFKSTVSIRKKLDQNNISPLQYLHERLQGVFYIHQTRNKLF